jgi:large subunit GTPase 1
VENNGNPSSNPYLLTEGEREETALKHNEMKDRLSVPRRPNWSTLSPEELRIAENESFLNWRRDLAELEETHGLLLTPFERNLEVWRQLWRVIERSDLVVQIVDARNPLFFRSIDLEAYVTSLDSRKKNLLLVNKADMLTLEQRKMWMDYFNKNNISFLFFSAELAKRSNDEEELKLTNDEVRALELKLKVRFYCSNA